MTGASAKASRDDRRRGQAGRADSLHAGSLYDALLLRRAKSLIGKSPESLAHLGHVYAVSGRKSAAQRVLDELKELSIKEYVPPYYKTLIYAGLQERDQAFEWLESAYQEHDLNMAGLKTDPMLDNLREDPRFISLLQRIGLMSEHP